MPVRIRLRARSTSSVVNGVALILSTVASNVPMVSSTDDSLRTWARTSPIPASCSCRLSPSMLEAFFVSTSALYSRPDGVSVRIWPASCNAA